MRAITMMTKGWVQITITIAAVIWALLLLVYGSKIDGGFVKPYSIAVGGTIVALNIFDRYLWRREPLKRIAKKPDLTGTWRGTLQSSWIDPATEVGIPPVTVFLVVRGTYSSIRASILTPESSSRSIVAGFDSTDPTACMLTATYVNTPQLLIQDRSRIHYGTLQLHVHGDPPAVLEGSYWTARDTHGQMRFDQRRTEHFTLYSEAERAFASSPGP